MISLFTILKSTDIPHMARIQRNALHAWQHIQPAPEIIVFGDKPGAAELCAELGITRIPQIAQNQAGLELVSDAFNQAWQLARYDTLAYVNADIILPPTLPYVVASIDAAQFLIVGQRHNTPVDFDLDFTPGWWVDLHALTILTGHRHTVNGIDYFIHRRGAFDPLPDLLVGRWYWDNYMLWRAQQERIPVIDATEAVLAIHQDHDYSHFPGGLGALGQGDESLANRQHLPDGGIVTIADADMRLLPAF